MFFFYFSNSITCAPCCILHVSSRGQCCTTDRCSDSVTNRTVALPLSNLTGLSSWYLATLNASMEIDVSEIKGNSEIQTSVSLHWDGAGGKLAWCAVNVSQSTEYYPPTVPWLWAARTRVVFEANNAERYNLQRATLSAWINHPDLSFIFLG